MKINNEKEYHQALKDLRTAYSAPVRQYDQKAVNGLTLAIKRYETVCYPDSKLLSKKLKYERLPQQLQETMFRYHRHEETTSPYKSRIIYTEEDVLKILRETVAFVLRKRPGL